MNSSRRPAVSCAACLSVSQVLCRIIHRHRRVGADVFPAQTQFCRIKELLLLGRHLTSVLPVCSQGEVPQRSSSQSEVTVLTFLDGIIVSSECLLQRLLCFYQTATKFPKCWQLKSLFSVSGD